jgi:hypothetical protein
MHEAACLDHYKGGTMEKNKVVIFGIIAAVCVLLALVIFKRSVLDAGSVSNDQVQAEVNSALKKAPASVDPASVPSDVPSNAMLPGGKGRR